MSGRSSPMPSPPTPSGDHGASKFAAAALLLEQMRASQLAEPLTEDSAAPESAANDPGAAAPAHSAANRTGRTHAPPRLPTESSNKLLLALAAIVVVLAVITVSVAKREPSVQESTTATLSNPASLPAEPPPRPAFHPRPQKAAPAAFPSEPAPPGTTAAEPSGSTSAEPARDVTRVVMSAKPAGAKFYLRGKEVGTTSAVVELGPGESRAFEVGKPGYATRKLVVDGSRPEIEVRLLAKRAEAPPAVAPAAAPAASAP